MRDEEDKERAVKELLLAINDAIQARGAHHDVALSALMTLAAMGFAGSPEMTRRMRKDACRRFEETVERFVADARAQAFRVGRERCPEEHKKG